MPAARPAPLIRTRRAPRCRPGCSAVSVVGKRRTDRNRDGAEQIAGEKRGDEDRRVGERDQHPVAVPDPLVAQPRRAAVGAVGELPIAHRVFAAQINDLVGMAGEVVVEQTGRQVALRVALIAVSSSSQSRKTTHPPTKPGGRSKVILGSQHGDRLVAGQFLATAARRSAKRRQC